MLIVTGASGQLGRGIVEKLATLVEPTNIGVSLRDPDQAGDLATRGVRVRRGDFSDAASLASAFEGAEQVLIVSADKLGAEARALHRTAIDAARAAGARRLLYTSHQGARVDSTFLPADQHAGTEADLAAAGVPFTTLRHGFYAESCLQMVGEALRGGDLAVPEDGPISWTARADLAEVDAAILAGRAAFDGATPPLTAGSAVTMAELAAIASEATGREVRHRTISDEAWVDATIARGVPAFYANLLLGTFRAARRGDFAATGTTLADLLGREPTAVGDVIAKFLAQPATA